MALQFLHMIIAVFFALSLFHKLHKRSVSTFLVFAIGFITVILNSLKEEDWALWVISIGLTWLYYRAMQKPPSDTIK